MRQIIKKNISIKNISLIFLSLYIITLFIFNYNLRLNFISEMFFIISFGTSLLAFILGEKKFKFEFPHLFITLFFLFSAISILWSTDQAVAFSHNIRLFQLYLLLLLVYHSIDNIDDLNLIIKSIFIGGILMSIYAFILYGLDGIINAIGEGSRLGGDVNQENSFGLYSAVTFFIGLYIAMFNKKKRYYIYILLPAIFIFLSGSRKAILIFIICLPIFFIFNSRKHIFIKTFVLYFFVIFFIYLTMNSTNLPPFLNRLDILLEGLFRDGELDNSSSTRIDMIRFGIQLFKEKPLFGYGASQYRIHYLHHFGEFRPPHNNYIDLLVSYGLIYFIIYYSTVMYFLYTLTKKYIKSGYSIYILFSLMMILFIINDFTSQSNTFKLFYIFLGLLFALFKKNTNKYRISEMKRGGGITLK